MTTGEMMKRFEDVIRDDALTPDDKIKTLRVEFAGFNLFFPEKDLNYSNKQERNRALMTDKRLGVPIADLMTKYHLSDASIYRIIRDCLDAEQGQKETN